MKIIKENPLAYLELLKAMQKNESASIVQNYYQASKALNYIGTPSLITWTSGTTGKPKGVVIPWEVERERHKASLEMYGGKDVLARTLSLRKQGVGQTLVSEAGLEVIVPRETYRDIATQIVEEKVTCLYATPSQFNKAAKYLKLGETFLKVIILTGELISFSISSPIPILNCYGTTETGDISINHIPHTGLRVRIVNGLIEVNTPFLAAKRLDNALPMNDGYYKTYDKGSYQNGKLFVSGRI